MKAIQSETSGVEDNNDDKLMGITTHTHAHSLQRVPILGQLWTAASVTLFPTGQMIRVSQNEYAHWNFVWQRFCPMPFHEPHGEAKISSKHNFNSSKNSGLLFSSRNVTFLWVSPFERRYVFRKSSHWFRNEDCTF